MATTDTDDSAIAAAASAGFRVIPNAGYRIAHRDRDQHDVVGERPEQVLADDRHGRPRQVDRGRDGTRVASDEGDVRCLDGDVRAGADRDTEVGTGDGGRVVDPVADHGHDQPARLEALDGGRLVSRARFGLDPIRRDADGARDGLGRRPPVAADEPDLDAGRGHASGRRPRQSA